MALLDLGCLAGLCGLFGCWLHSPRRALAGCSAHLHSQPINHGDPHDDSNAHAHDDAHAGGNADSFSRYANANSHIHPRIDGDAYDHLRTTARPDRLLL